MKQSIQKQKTLVEKIAQTLVNYIQTQCVVMTVVFVTVWIILTLLNVQFALLLALVTGALSIVPMFGLMTAALLAGIVATFDGVAFLSQFHPVIEGMVIIGIYIVLNQMIDFFLAPYLVGKLTNIHPIIIFLSVLLGTAIFGIAGTILAVLIILIVKTIWVSSAQNS